MSFNHALKRLIGRIPPLGWATSRLARYTPDIMELEEKDFHLLFVPDEMMVGHRKYDELLNEHSACLHAAFTQNKYTHVLHKLGDQKSYPIMFEENISGMKNVNVKGEVFAVISNHFKKLDDYKLNGVEFIRKRIPLVVPTSHILQGEGNTQIVPNVEHIKLITAWCYVGNYDYFINYLDGGYAFTPVNTYKSNRDWTKEFSYFTEEEYEKN